MPLGVIVNCDFSFRATDRGARVQYESIQACWNDVVLWDYSLSACK